MSASAYASPAQLHAVKEAELEALLAELSRSAKAVAAIPASDLASMAEESFGRELLEQAIATLQHQSHALTLVADSSRTAAEHVTAALRRKRGSRA